MDLATHQRKLLGLIRSSYQVRDDDDPYIQRVAHSNDLREARRNIFLWRLWVLERTCFLTCNLLKQRKLLDETLTLFMTRQNLSPFRETHAPAFLDMLSRDSDCLIASVAQFELALMKVRQGDPGTFIVNWSVEPHSVLYNLARDIPLADSAPSGTYEIHISHELPSHFEIHRPT
jgi:hypothetical protein